MPDLSGSRFITRFQLDATNNALRGNDDGTLSTVTLPVGYYHWAADGLDGDGTPENPYDFRENFINAWAASPGFSSFNVDVMWVNETTGDALTTAAGRVKYWRIVADPFSFLFDDPLTTLDPRIMGFPPDAGTVGPAASIMSPWIHRYGWYPQIDYEELITDRGQRAHTEMTTGGYLHGLRWGQDKRFSVSFYARPPGLARIDAGLIQANMDDIFATLGDENISYEAWVIDLIEDVEKVWRFYELSTDTAKFWGPYKFLPGEIWTRPLSGATAVSHKAGELWNALVDGQEARE